MSTYRLGIETAIEYLDTAAETKKPKGKRKPIVSVTRRFVQNRGKAYSLTPDITRAATFGSARALRFGITPEMVCDSVQRKLNIMGELRVMP